MPGDLPARMIDRGALERIIQRAAELQAGEMDTGEHMTEPELLKLGAEVGIDGRFLRQALYEENAGAEPDEHGLLARWVGPGRVRAGRVVPGDRVAVEQALDHWMTDGEALTVKRRMADRTVWERQKGFIADMKRGFGVGGRSYHLAKAHDVTVAVAALEPGYCHVELTADLTGRRGAVAAGGAAAFTVLGGFGLAVATLFSGPAFGLAIGGGVPVLAGAAVPLVANRLYRRLADRVHLALEQVLDRLERGEIKARHAIAADPRWPGLVGIAEEVRRVIGTAAGPRRPPQGRLPRP